MIWLEASKEHGNIYAEGKYSVFYIISFKKTADTRE
jgi:hypothetical protein